MAGDLSRISEVFLAESRDAAASERRRERDASTRALVVDLLAHVLVDAGFAHLDHDRKSVPTTFATCEDSSCRDVRELTARAKRWLSAARMTRDQIEQKVVALVRDQFGLGDEPVEMGAHLADDLGADSLDSVELTMAVEQAFDVSVPDEDAVAADTVGKVVALVERLLAGRTS